MTTHVAGGVMVYAAARDRKVSGIFDADDPAPLIQFVEQFPDAVVERSEERIVIRPR